MAEQRLCPTPTSARRAAACLQVNWAIVLAVLLFLSGCDNSNPAVPPSRGPYPQSCRRWKVLRPALNVSNLDTETLHDEPHAVHLIDITPLSQIDFVHDYDCLGEMLIVEPVASGMASLDFDLDGWIDAYFLNGAQVPADPFGPSPMRFSETWAICDLRTQPGRVGAMTYGYSLGVAVADFDGDGFPDLFVNNFGPNKLFRNNGDGTFCDATLAAGVQCGPELGAGACFLDIDGDGLLDLYVGNYVKQPVEANIKRTTDGFASYPGPLDFEPEYDFLFRNEGDGSFSDQSQAAGISLVATTSMGTIAGDFDEDGDSDVIVVNDVDRNLFYPE